MSALGDAVHVLPVVTALKRHRPSCRITWILQPGPASLVRGHPGVDEIIVFRRSRGWRAFVDIARELRGREFDLVIDFQVYLKAGIVTALTRAPVKLGFDRKRARDFNWLFTNTRIPPHPTGQHVQDQYFEFLAALGIPWEPVEWNLGPWPGEEDLDHDFFARIQRPIATIVVATSKPVKDWPAERWAEVVDVLYEHYGLQPVLAGGDTPADHRAVEIIRRLARHAPVEKIGGTLRAMVGLLSRSVLVLSPDTGPMHMAIALDRPVIGLCGYLDPRRVGPYRKYQDLVINAYHDPGEVAPISWAPRFGRMPRITVADVLDKVRVWHERYDTRPARTG